MKYLASLFLALSLFAVASPAQTVQPALNTFSVEANAVSLPGGKQTFMGSLAGVTLGLTQNFELRQTNLISPSNMTGIYGGFDYNIAPFSKWLNDLSPQLNGFDFRAEVTASAGVVRIPVGGGVAQHYSAILGGRLAYSIKGSKNYNLVCEFQMARLPQFATGWTPIVSAGPLFTFGSKAPAVTASVVPTF